MGSFTMTDKRDAPRLKIGAPIRFRMNGNGGISRGVVVDMSRTGVLFESDQDLELGTIINAEIEEAQDGAILRFSGVIVRVEHSGLHNTRYGCRFNNWSDH